jgi:tRNA threonylcarbamoyladenosine biosynthesis protein TsaE
MIIKGENEMINLAYRSGVQLAKSIEQNIVIYLSGDLGSGKTTFTKGLIRGLGFEGLVTSPTFSIVETIETELFLIFHIDLYRLERAQEVIELGLHEEPNYKKPSIIIIEWPEKGHHLILPPDIKISFENTKIKDERQIELKDDTNKLGNTFNIG